MNLLRIGYFRQSIASLSAAMSMFVAACVFTWMAPLADHLISEGSPIPMTDDDRSKISLCLSISSTIWCVPTGLIAHKWGRKTVLFWMGPISLVGWILMMNTRSLAALYVAAAIHGITLTGATTISTTYISEIVAPKYRGTFCGQYMAIFYLGGIYVNLTAYFVNYTVYLYLLALISIIYTLLLILMPESPYYLLMVGNEVEALKNLNWLSPENDFKINQEKLILMKSSLDNKFNWKDFLFVHHQRKALILLIFAHSLRAFGGQISLLLYLTQIFSKIANNTQQAILLTTLINFLLCIGCYMFSLISDLFSRRSTVCITGIGSAIFHFIITIYFYLHNSNVNTFTNSDLWIIFTSMTLSLILGNASMTILIPTVSNEYMITEGRPLGTSIAHGFAGLALFVQVIIYQIVKENIGDYLNFFIYAICSLLSVTMVLFFIKETSRKTLEQLKNEIHPS